MKRCPPGEAWREPARSVGPSLACLDRVADSQARGRVTGDGGLEFRVFAFADGREGAVESSGRRLDVPRRDGEGRLGQDPFGFGVGERPPESELGPDGGRVCEVLGRDITVSQRQSEVEDGPDGPLIDIQRLGRDDPMATRVERTTVRLVGGVGDVAGEVDAAVASARTNPTVRTAGHCRPLASPSQSILVNSGELVSLEGMAASGTAYQIKFY